MPEIHALHKNSIKGKILPPGLDWTNPKFSSLFAVSSENAFTQNDRVSLPSFTRIGSSVGQVSAGKVTTGINVKGIQDFF